MLAFIWVPVTLLKQTQPHLCTQDPSALGHSGHGPGQLLVGALQPGQQLCWWPRACVQGATATPQLGCAWQPGSALQKPPQVAVLQPVMHP